MSAQCPVCKNPVRLAPERIVRPHKDKANGPCPMNRRVLPESIWEAA